MNIASEAVGAQEQASSEALDEGVARFLGLGDTDAGVRIADIRAKAASELKRYGDDVIATLAQAAITIPPAVQIRSGADNGIEVVGEHAAREQIETLINGDTRLLKWFKEIEVLHEILRRAELRNAEELPDNQHFNLGLTSLGAIAFFAV
ncbi:hypothetical protein JCM19000A_03030 [Silvimonas sp. JCM 19000]